MRPRSDGAVLPANPSPARAGLAALLDPLDARPELSDTLRTFVPCGLDRRRTAARLQVHPNTVDYRLREAMELTGLDTVRGADLLVLQAAFAVRDAVRQPPRSPGEARTVPREATGPGPDCPEAARTTAS